MAIRKINPEYLSYYNTVEMIQPLARGYEMRQVADKFEDTWHIMYMTNAPFAICPFDGMQRTCRDCEGNEDENKCQDRRQELSPRALCDRINDCLKAGLRVEYIE